MEPHELSRHGRVRNAPRLGTARNARRARAVRRAARILGTTLVAAGVLATIWAVVVLRWEDPFTALYAAHRQSELSAEYEKRIRRPPTTRPRPEVSSLERLRAELAREARRYRLTLGHGKAMGRIRIPRLDLDAIVTNGSDRESLYNGPGRDERTFMPGEGELVYIAGHRTTYGAPFSHIERLRPGDLVVLEVPYATFRYRISGYEVVPKDAVEKLRSRGFELLTLQASHPRFFSTHRYLAFALADRVLPRGAKRWYDLWRRAVRRERR